MKSRPEYYAIGNVGDYTLSRYKVVFKDLTDVFQCAVVGPQESSQNVVIPDHTLLFLTSDSEDEAHFLCGLLNFKPVRVGLYSASVGVQTQRYFPTDVSRVKIPEFRAKDERHLAIAKLSRECHKRAAISPDLQSLDLIETQLSVAPAALWGISPTEHAYLAKAYDEIRSFRKQPSVEVSEDL